MFVKAVAFITRHDTTKMKTDTDEPSTSAMVNAVASGIVNTNQEEPPTVTQISRTDIPTLQNDSYFTFQIDLLKRIEKCKFLITHSFIPNKNSCLSSVVQLEEKIPQENIESAILSFNKRLKKLERTIQKLYKGDLENLCETLGPDLIKYIFSFLTHKEHLALKLSSKMLKARIEEIEQS